MKHAVIIGLGSDIAQGLAERLREDGWTTSGTTRTLIDPPREWNLLIVAQGTMEPIGRFFDTDQAEWQSAIWVNALAPLGYLRRYWQRRRLPAKVCFLGGPNMAKPTPTYSAYRAGKAVLEALVPTLNAEYPDTHFFMLHPGVVATKIHQQTLKAGRAAANLERVRGIVDGTGERTATMDEVYAKLREHLEGNK